MNRKVLVTGAGGFLGSRICRYGIAGCEVTGVSHRELDLTNGQACLDALTALRPDAVVHCAAISQIDRCDWAPELSRRVNVDGTLNLARACRASGARLIACSTDQVYGGCGGDEPLPETVLPAPKNLYARQKLEAEAGALSICPDAVLLRLSWMFDLPQHGLSTNPNIMVTALRALVRDEPLRVWNNDHRGMTYACEVAQNLAAFLDAPAGVYNAGSCNPMTSYETFRFVFQAFGAQARADKLLIPLGTGEKGGRNLLMDGRKAATVGAGFGSTADGVRRLIRDYGLDGPA